MLLFRSLTTGLLGACVLLLLDLQPPPVALPACPSTAVPDQVREVRIPPSSTWSIVDVSPAIRAADLASLVPLAAGEHVVAIGDRPVDSDLAAGALIGSSRLVSGQYLDLTVSGLTSTRRVLLLMH
jgi:hypothetical protein